MLDPIIITATGGAINLRDAPASVTVVPGEDLRKIPGQDLNQVLSRLPGLSMGTTPDGGTSLQIRGLPEQYTLVLVDGRRIGSSRETYDRYTRNDLNWIPKDSIESVEVIRGPMSSLYGSDAMGGVINIITKKHADRWGGSITLGGELNPESIRGDDYNASFSLGGPVTETLRLSLSGQYLDQEADKDLPDGVSSTRWGGGREGSKIGSGNIGLDWEVAPGHDLALDYDFGNWRTLGGPDPAASNPGSTTAPRGPAKMTRESFGLSYEGQLSFGTARFSANHSEYRNRTTAPEFANGVATGVNYETDATAQELVLDGSVSMPFTWGYDHNLTLGAQWARSELDNPNSLGSRPIPGQVLGDSLAKTSSFAVFAEDSVTLLEDLTLTLGLRADKHEDFGSHLSPRAYLVWHPSDEWTIRGGYSTGFRAPSLRQSSRNFVEQSRGAGCILVGACSTLGNPDLKPETTQNFEIGASWDRGGWSLGVTAFHTDFENKLNKRLLPVSLGGGVNWQEYVNVDEAVTSGIEASLRVPLIENGASGWAENLTWSTNLTWMAEAKDSKTGQPLTSTPKWSLSTALDWQVNENLNLSAQGNFVGKQLHLDWRNANHDSQFGSQRISNSSMLFDLGASYSLHEHAQINLGVKNLFDRNVSGDIDTGNNFYVPGRRAFISLTTTF